VECWRVKELLSEYVDDVLDPGLSLEMREHLVTCGDCSAELESLQSYLAAMQSLERLRAPADFLEGMRERLQKPSVTRRLLDKLLVPWHIKVPLEVAGICAVVLLIILTHQEPKGERRLLGTTPLLQDSHHPPSPTQSIQLTQKDQAGRAGQERFPGAGEDFDEMVDSWESGKWPENSTSAQPIQLALVMRQPSGSRQGAFSEVREPAKEKSGTALPPAPPGEDAAEQPRLRAEESQAGPGSVAGRTQQEMEKARHNSEAAPANSKTGNPIAQLLDDIAYTGGSILAIEYDRTTSRPQAVVARIPARKYSQFTQNLQQMGELHTLPGASKIDRDADFLTIRISLVFRPDARSTPP
jgi:hypothetical protein